MDPLPPSTPDLASQLSRQTPRLTFMKARRTHSPAVRALAGCLGFFLAAAGQETAAAQPSPAPGSPSPEIVELSPFTVQGTDDVGYLARSSLAGTRLSQPLADTAAQISVFTREMLADLAVTGIDQAFMYSTNVDTFAEGFVEEGGDNGATRGSAFLNNGNRSRGVGVLTNTREFFTSSFATDTYNSERFTVASGPNSLLFGLGSPAGVVDTSLKRAGFRDSFSAEVRRDNWEGYRNEVDLNRVLWRQRLAVRFTGLWSDAKGFLAGTTDENRRVFGTATFRPWEGTEIRVAGERIWREASLASMLLPRDQVTPWWDAGRRGFNNAAVTTRTQVATQIASQGLNNLLTPTTSRLAAFVWGGNGANAGSYLDLSLQATTQEPRLQPGVKAQDQALPPWSLRRPEIVDPRFNAFAGGMAVRHEGGINNASIEQRILRDLSVEFAAMQERFVENKGSFWRPDILNIQADPNLFLGNGRPNPDFGRLFVQTDAFGARSRVNQRSARATVAWSPDLTRRAGWQRHLGRYTVAGLYEVWSSESKAQNFRLSTYDQQSWMTAAQYNNGLVADRLLAVRYYLGDSKQRTRPSFASGIIDFQEPVRVTLPDGRALTYTMWNGEGAYGLPGGSKQRTASKVLSAQGHYLRDRVVVYAGYREDDVRRAQSLTADSVARLPWKLNTGAVSNLGPYKHMDRTEYVDWDFAETGRSLNWGTVVRVWKGLQLHYSESENFAVQPSTSFTPFGVPIPGSNGVGRDYGAGMHLAEGRLMVRVNFWDTDVINGSPTNVVISQVRDYPQSIENRILIVAPEIKPLGMDLRRYHEFDYQVTNTRASQGMDVEIIGNPTPDWRVLFTAGRQVSKLSLDNTWFDWVEQRLPVWKTFGRGWDVETINETSSETIRARYNQWVAIARDPLRASSGEIADSQRKWRANLVLSRQFRGGLLRGLTLGGGARYRSAAYVGYPLTKLPGGQEILDIARPVQGDPEFYVDAFARYAFRKIPWLSERVRVQAQLNVRNLLDAGGFNVVEVRTDGSPKVYRHMTPRQLIFALKVAM